MFGKGNPPGGGRRENLTLDVDEFNMRYSLTDGAGWESIGRKLKRFAYTRCQIRNTLQETLRLRSQLKTAHQGFRNSRALDQGIAPCSDEVDQVMTFYVCSEMKLFSDQSCILLINRKAVTASAESVTR